MNILAIDTSTTSGSVAILRDGRIAAEWTLQSAQTHNRRLLKTVDTLLREAGWTLKMVDVYAVTTGPGSFTGIRIGLTAAKTLAWTMKKPLVGIATLDVLAAPLRFTSLQVCTMLDARKKEVYFALYRSNPEGTMRRLLPYRVSQPSGVAELIDKPTLFCGDGWLVYRDLFRERLGDLAVEAPAPFHVVRAASLGELGEKRLKSGQSNDPITIMPLYVRPSEAEINYPHIPGMPADGPEPDANPYV